MDTQRFNEQRISPSDFKRAQAMSVNPFLKIPPKEMTRDIWWNKMGLADKFAYSIKYPDYNKFDFQKTRAELLKEITPASYAHQATKDALSKLWYREGSME